MRNVALRFSLALFFLFNVVTNAQSNKTASNDSPKVMRRP